MRALDDLDVQQLLLHTGQHYDEALSAVFFRDLDLPSPDINLQIGSGSQAAQTAAILSSVEQPLVDLAPCAVVVYGDVNSTLATALACAKLGIPLVHVEAGLRSFDRSMPEEVNRVVTDALAAVHFVTSPEAIGHLRHEGIAAEHVYFVGNPMIDTLMDARAAIRASDITERLGLPSTFGVVTLHRPVNVDNISRATRIVRVLQEVAQDLELIFPLHPRGTAVLQRAGLFDQDRIRVIDPLGYLDFVALISRSALVLTDSGGVQEETTILRVPCITLRTSTERPVTVTHGTNRLVGEDVERVPIEVAAAMRDPVACSGPPLWDGRAGRRIASQLKDLFSAGPSG